MWQPHDSAGDWVTAAAGLPIAFAQVREDPLIDRELVCAFDRPPRVLMIASGGETAAFLSTLPTSGLVLVDVNPAQIALTRLKIQLLQNCEPAQRLRLLGHEPMDADERSNDLSPRLQQLGIAEDGLGPAALVAKWGPDFCGRYEWLFARMRDLLADRTGEFASSLRLADPEARRRAFSPASKLGQAIDAAFDEVMDLNRLISIFGPDATANRVQPFARHFASQTRLAIERPDAKDNPFLWQIFFGRFAGPTWPWLEAPIQRSPQIGYECSAMHEYLKTADDASFDLIHLSNILDWIEPTEAADVLANTRRCLRDGGKVVIRQLNSKLDIQAVDAGISWLNDLAGSLHRADQSFFYRRLHVGERR